LDCVTTSDVAAYTIGHVELYVEPVKLGHLVLSKRAVDETVKGKVPLKGADIPLHSDTSTGAKPGLNWMLR
jgi:hypothetical protein